jgi:hypothetical protein
MLLKTIQQFLKNLLDILLDGWYQVEDALYVNKRKTIIRLIVTLVIVLCGTLAMILVNSSIRTNQLNRLVLEDVPNEQITPVAYNKIQKQIKDKKAVSVMFSKPSGPAYDQAMTLIQKKEDELNRKFYYYPLVYDSAVLSDQYDLDVNDVTFVFFENDKEKNRVTVKKLKDLDENLIPEINRLPMWNLKVDEEK